VADPASVPLLSRLLDIGSAVLGIWGTYLMSRRYTTSLLLFLVLALVTPVMFLLGRGQAVYDYYEKRTMANRDVPVAIGRMALGLGLLCWAFFFQLLNALTS